MTIRAIGALLCGAVFLLATQTGALAVEKKGQVQKQPGVQQSYAASNIRHPPGLKAGGNTGAAKTTPPKAGGAGK